MFTIIIPTHDRPVLLRRTLQSLIKQSYRHFTVIIVDDSGAYIPPYEILQELQGRYVYMIRSGIKGPAESRNMGLDLVRSPYVIFLDDDDTFEPEHLQALAEQIGDSAPEIVSCDFRVVNEDRTQTPPLQLSTGNASTLASNATTVFIINRIPNSCLAYRRDVVAAVRYATDMVIYEDWDFLLSCIKGRVLRHVPINSVNIHKSLANAPENMRRGNSRDDLIAEAMLHLYKKHQAPDMATRLARQSLMASAGVPLPLELC